MSSVAICALTSAAAAQTAPLTGPALSSFQNTGANGLSGQNADACSYPPYSGTTGNPSESVSTNFSTGLTSGTEYFATLLLVNVTGGQGGAGGSGGSCYGGQPGGAAGDGGTVDATVSVASGAFAFVYSGVVVISQGGRGGNGGSTSSVSFQGGGGGDGGNGGVAKARPAQQADST
ncbi:MAG: hypothetical protein E2577_01520, partial [Starkeya sp.]|nr:hypothetical protein [Starkeya sp.]